MSLVGGAIRYFPLHICRARIPLGGPTNSLIRSKILLLHQYKFLSPAPPKRVLQKVNAPEQEKVGKLHVCTVCLFTAEA